MDFFETVAKRGSYRGEFTDAPVPEADIERILTAGLRAPSGYNRQTTSFVAVTDGALRKAIAALLDSPAARTAPVMLVPLSSYWEAPNGLSFETEDYACATENVMLAITAAGYAGVWMDGRMKLDGNAERVAALLHVPAGMRVRAVIPFGVPKNAVTQKEKQPYAARVYRDTCDGARG